MKVNYLWRKPDANEQSIERLFGFVRAKINNFDIQAKDIKATGRGGIKNLLKDIYYFRKMVGKNEIAHITGDVHFAAIALKTNKIIITVHDLGTYRQLPWYRNLIFYIFWIYLPFKKATHIVAISDKTKKEIVKAMPSVAHKVIVIPNCVTIDIEEKTELKGYLKPRVLIIGTRENKNIERAICALEGLDIELTIVGRLNNEQTNLLAEKKLDYKNSFNVTENDLIEIYRQSDYLLFPSLYEGFGLPILEAQAQNVLVITSNISPMKEICGENSGVLVDPLSVESIRAGITNALKLSNDDKLALIKSAKINIEKYTPDLSSRNYMKLYEMINYDFN